MSASTAPKPSGSRVGDDLVEAFQEMAAYLRGELEVESYELPDAAPPEPMPEPACPESP